MRKLSKSITYETSLKERLFVEINHESLQVYFETWSNGYKQYESFHTINASVEKIKKCLNDMQIFGADPNTIMDFIFYG